MAYRRRSFKSTRRPVRGRRRVSRRRSVRPLKIGYRM